MTDNEINRAIAKSLGWTFYGQPEQMIGRPRGYSFNDGPCMDIPNYCEDLNAIVDAVKRKRSLNWPRYVEELESITGSLLVMHLIQASARDRAEAYLRVLGKWKSKPQ